MLYLAKILAFARLGPIRGSTPRLGVDAYSSNRVLQKEWNSVGWGGGARQLGASLALAPVSGPAVSVSQDDWSGE